jgi:hypothetical protein
MLEPPLDNPRLRSDPPAQPPASVFPTTEEIAIRAFEMFVENNRQVSRRDCWRRAEALLLDRAARRVTR